MMETERLELAQLSYDDCEFVRDLVNEPSFIRYIGDRGVRSLDDAYEYLRKGPLDSYEKHGYGLYRVCHRCDTTPLGICGLVKRDEFPHPDLGFAFLERHWGRGYAYESSLATLDHARNKLALKHIIAVADGDNEASIKLLRKLGFQFEDMVRMSGESKEICRYALDLPE
ncbi:MAG: GNAT family N-acetyltransferase [Proteobacteria bacterium]|nr:GNAT family N-acetyltransferase [Pseudomonadota bacterium]